MQYAIGIEKCLSCGQKLPRKVKPEKIMKGPHPWGRCPKCGQAYLLAEIESKTVVEPAPEPEPEAEPPAETPEEAPPQE